MEIDTKKKKLTVDRGSEVETEEGVFTTTISQIQEVDKEEFLKSLLVKLNSILI
jgi:transcription antitermination factor NusG